MLSSCHMSPHVDFFHLLWSFLFMLVWKSVLRTWMSMSTPPSMKFTFFMRRVFSSVCSSTLRASCWAPIRPGCISPRWGHRPPPSFWACAALKCAPHHENSDIFVKTLSCLYISLIVSFSNIFSGIYVFECVSLCLCSMHMCTGHTSVHLRAEARAGDWICSVSLLLEADFHWTDVLWVRLTGKCSQDLPASTSMNRRCGQSRPHLSTGHLNQVLRLAQQMFLHWASHASGFWLPSKKGVLFLNRADSLF